MYVDTSTGTATMSREAVALTVAQHRPEAAAIRTAAALTLRGADESARRSGAVPVDVRRLAPSTCRLRGHALRRFASWTEAHPHPDLSSAADAYAEHLLEDGAAIATVAGDLGALRWWAGCAGIEGAAQLGRAPLADARRDGDRRRRGRGQAGAITWKQADRISRRMASRYQRSDGHPEPVQDHILSAPLLGAFPMPRGGHHSSP